MLSRDLVISNKLGLHVRAATLLINTASEFEVEIRLHCNGQEADAKSIMEVLMLAGTMGTPITLTCEGDEEEELQAMDSLEELINNKFNEKE